MRQAILYQHESGDWVAECPSLPGCNTQGDSFEETVENMKDAVMQYVESLVGEGEPVPEEDLEAVENKYDVLKQFVASLVDEDNPGPGDDRLVKIVSV